MKYTLKIAAIAISLVLVAFATPEKKVNKLAAKVWKDKEVVIQTMEVPADLKPDVLTLSVVKSEGKIIGYACYTSAFGCKIGGCAAPSNPNYQSYETFDYIVVYDTDLNIKKVDIANYGGEYGYEICRPKWLKQFIGKNHGFKLEDDIDGISGATVSAKFLIDDLNSLGAKLETTDLSNLSASAN
ncbi:MAG: hypothetical protein HRT57_17980 [Crocinitomicaceae bacterium]|nr:hypothetical protein [Crocinitomicaceae bacterium]